MPEDKVWRSTPRKLAALADVHIKVNGSGEESPQDDGKDAVQALMSW